MNVLTVDATTLPLRFTLFTVAAESHEKVLEGEVQGLTLTTDAGQDFTLPAGTTATPAAVLAAWMVKARIRVDAVIHCFDASRGQSGWNWMSQIKEDVAPLQKTCVEEIRKVYGSTVHMAAAAADQEEALLTCKETLLPPPLCRSVRARCETCTTK